MNDKIKDFLMYLLIQKFPCVEVGFKLVESAEMVNAVENACPFSFTAEDKIQLFLRCAVKAICCLVILAVLERFFYPVSLELINTLKVPTFAQPICHFITASILAKLLWNYM